MASRRPAVLALWIGLVIAAVAGVLGVLHAMTPNYDALREQLGREIGEVEALPAGDPGRKDRRIEELLDVEEYRTHARALWLKLERLHGPVHQAALADRAAGKAVPPFLARCSSMEGLGSDELRTRDDEARSLLGEHGSTRFGPALVEVRSRIASALAASASWTETDNLRVLSEAEKDRIEGRFAKALERLNRAVPMNLGNERMLRQLGQAREAVRESAEAAAEKILSAARNGRKDEGAGLLERSLPNFSGLPAEGRLRALLAELRRP